MTLRLFLLALLFAALYPLTARAIDRNVAGSAQIDYAFVPTEKSDQTKYFDGFTTEMALKLAADITDHVSANVKVCYGCHGFELDMAYFDFRVADELNFRAGHFSPSFGSFNLRHDVANHKLSDKPLPYDMGRMLRLRTWNLGVLPSPFPDNGFEVDGTHWFGDSAQLDYAVYAVSGFKSSSKFDLDFTQSRQLYYVDNNQRPTTGARLALTLKLAASSDLTLGASGMFGWYDVDNSLTYAIFGGDAVLRIDKTNIRVEYLARRQQFDTTNVALLRFTVPSSGGDFFMKHGGYIEVEQPLSRVVDLIVRADGLYRIGNLLQADPNSALLSRKSGVYRGTLGVAYTLERGLRLKLSTEGYKFTDQDQNGRDVDVAVHAAMVGSF